MNHSYVKFLYAKMKTEAGGNISPGCHGYKLLLDVTGSSDKCNQMVQKPNLSKHEMYCNNQTTDYC